MVIGYKRWLSQGYLLDRLTRKGLVRAYFAYPAIQVYLLLAVLSGAMAIYLFEAWIPIVLSGALAVLVYPLVWYLLHRFVLHGRWLYKSPRTAALWKRIHFDHHQNPNDLAVLFGGLYTTLPTIAIVTIGLGWLVGGPAGAATAFAAGLVTTCFYEYCHCIQHLNYKPRFKFLQRIKRLHLAHHFHNEQGNFGITNFVIDRLLGTFYNKPSYVPLSDTVRNLGYAGAETDRYPWVANLTERASRAEPARQERGAA